MSEKYITIEGNNNGKITYTKEHIEIFAELLKNEIKNDYETILSIKNALIHLFISPEEFSKENYSRVKNTILEDSNFRKACNNILERYTVYKNIPIKKIPVIEDYCTILKENLQKISTKNFDKGFLLYNSEKDFAEQLSIKGLSEEVKGVGSVNGKLTSTLFGEFYQCGASLINNKVKVSGEVTYTSSQEDIFISQEGEIWSLGEGKDSVVTNYKEYKTATDQKLCIIITRNGETHIFDENNSEVTHLSNSPYKLLAYHGVKEKLPEQYFSGGVADIVSLEMDGKIVDKILLDKEGQIKTISIEGKDFIIAGDIAEYNYENRVEFRTASGEYIYPSYEQAKILQTLDTNKNILLYDNITGKRNNYTIDKNNTFISLKTPNGEERYLLSYLDKYDFSEIKKWDNKVRYPAYGVNIAGECKKIYVGENREILTSGKLVEDVVEFDNKKNRTPPFKNKENKEERFFSSIVRNKDGEERAVQLFDDMLYKSATKNPQEEVIKYDDSIKRYFEKGIGLTTHRQADENKKKIDNQITKIITKKPLRLCTTRRKNGTERTAYWTENGSLYYPDLKKDGYIIKIGDTHKHIVYGEVQEVTLETEDGKQYVRFLSQKGELLPDEFITFGKIFTHLNFGEIQEVTIKTDSEKSNEEKEDINNEDNNQLLQNKETMIYINSKGKYIDEKYFANQIKFKEVLKETVLRGQPVRKVLVSISNLPPELAKKGGEHEIDVRSGPGPDITDTYIDKQKVEIYIGSDNNPLYIGDSMITKIGSSLLGLQNIEIYDDETNSNKNVVINKNNKFVGCQIQGKSVSIESLDTSYFLWQHNGKYDIEREEKIIYGKIQDIKNPILLKQEGDILLPETYGLDIDYIHYGYNKGTSEYMPDVKINKDTIKITLKGYKNDAMKYVTLQWSPVAIKGNKTPIYNAKEFTINIK